jgi:hypothetical protein
VEIPTDDPDSLPRLELVSLYINSYYTLDADRRSRFEAAFRKRKLPLPRMPQTGPAPRRPATIDKDCFRSYIFLIYSGTAVFYSWIYLAERLVKMDFGTNLKHKLIQSGIALFYIIAEILLFGYLSGGFAGDFAGAD